MSSELKDRLEMQQEFLEIFTAWEDDVSSSEIYDMIAVWIFQYKTLIRSQKEIEDISRRMASNESINPIIEDFIYGECYRALRREFNRHG